MNIAGIAALRFVDMETALNASRVLAYRPKPKTKAAKRRKRRNQYAKRRKSESSI